jgi:hypothetical protein
MSWQTYVDEHLMCEIEGHHLTAAAIVGHDGAVWAQSAAFPQVISTIDRMALLLLFLFIFLHCFDLANINKLLCVAPSSSPRRWPTS